MDIIMTGFAGQKGTALIARSRREELLAYLPSDLIDSAASVNRGYDIPDRCEAFASQKISRDGVRGALRLLEARVGCAIIIDYRLIPIHQETVEICETLQLDPYDLDGEGAWLAAVRDKDKALRECAWTGVPAAFVGVTMSQRLLN